jgi:uncharacterized membrane protein
VYYNFPEISLGNNVNSSGQILLGENRNTNIKVNDINYTAYSAYVVGKDNDSNTPTYFVVLCYSDANDQSSKAVYVVCPLTTSSQQTTPSDIDNIIQGGNNVKFELNKYIGDNSGCFITNLTESHITITLTETQIPIKRIVSKSFYPLSNLTDISIHHDNTSNAVLKKQDMDWVMTCDLLTEDGPTETQSIDPTSTATTITMFFMAIIISIFAYNAGPIVYTETGLYNFANKTNNGASINHYSINVYWFVILGVLALLWFVQGITTNTSIMLFSTMAIIMSYFAFTRGVLKLADVGNDRADNFKERKNAFAVFLSVFSYCHNKNARVGIIILYFILLVLFGWLVTEMALHDLFRFAIASGVFIAVAFGQLIAIYITFNSTGSGPSEISELSLPG